MPSPVTVYDLLVKSMRLVNIIAVAETPDAEEINDALYVLQDMLEAWQIESLAVWPVPTVSFNLVSGQRTRTIGPSGNFNVTPRPDKIPSAYTTYQGVDIDVEVIDQYTYNLIPLKDMSAPIVERMLYIPDWPLGILTFWPVPSANNPIVLTYTGDGARPGIVSLTDMCNWPPGYSRAVRYNLATQLAPEYGRFITTEVSEIARVSKGKLKVTNWQAKIMRVDPLLQDGNGSSSWQLGD